MIADNILSDDQPLSGAGATYEASTASIAPFVLDAIRSAALDCAVSRFVDTLCAGFVGAVQVAASFDENHTISRWVDDLLLMWRGVDPAAGRMVEEASL